MILMGKHKRKHCQNRFTLGFERFMGYAKDLEFNFWIVQSISSMVAVFSLLNLQ
jgi:hypothetical protein